MDAEHCQMPVWTSRFTLQLHADGRNRLFHWTLYSFSPEDEYEAVVFLPKGSRNIEVVKRGKARHFIGKYFAFDAISLARFLFCFA